jgi:hypothetical protein
MSAATVKRKFAGLIEALGNSFIPSAIIQIFFDSNGDPVEVSAANPLPVDASVSFDTTGLATEAKQDTLIAKDFATQTTLAAVLAKIIAAPATEAKQDTGNSSLATIATLLANNSIYYLANAAAKAEVKASAGTVKKIFGENKTQETRYIQIFNALATNVTLGTTAPTYVIPIAASGFFEFDLNITHSTAISYAVTETETGLTTAALATLNIAYQ